MTLFYYIFNSNRSNVDIDKANNSYNNKNGGLEKIAPVAVIGVVARF